MRRRLWVLSILGAAGLAAIGTTGCATKKPPPAAGGAAAVTEIPDLRGLWAFVTHVDLTNQDGPERTASQLVIYRIHERGEQPSATHLEVTLPASVQQSLSAAGKARVRWQPTVAELAGLRGSLLANPPSDTGASGDFRIFLPAQYGPLERQDPDSAGAAFYFVIHDKDPNPPPAQTTAHYVTVLEPDHLGGRFSAGALQVAGGVPVPVGFHGTFDLYRLGD